MGEVCELVFCGVKKECGEDSDESCGNTDDAYAGDFFDDGGPTHLFRMTHGRVATTINAGAHTRCPGAMCLLYVAETAVWPNRRT